ncbi:hypothetical protein [Lysobacter sp. ESA13C]|uniref:hypothetical protein n=1 Tax=Lysobacter sp. ESA13C TaxID=2862676 RepID=UPI001CBB0549|nr:hypothetical protein [Lysobacter sp. ESA13C]
MRVEVFSKDLTAQLSYLFGFARQINELDFSGSLSGEFRGAQDSGWNTMGTANEVYGELVDLTSNRAAYTHAELRVILLLYCQLSEAGGFYETVKNMMGVVSLKPYVLWPFQHLVRVRTVPRAVIGPNANATFRDLAKQANDIGLTRLSSLLTEAFRDDIRNGVAHADYVLRSDGLRLRKRNGGNAFKLSFQDVGAAITIGKHFFENLRAHVMCAMKLFDPPREIFDRFSASPPMPWTVSYRPGVGLSISTSSPGAAATPDFLRQQSINSRLGGKVLAVYMANQTVATEAIWKYIEAAGFAPHDVELPKSDMEALISEIDRLDLWDARTGSISPSDLLLASPWGFRWIHSEADFDEVLPGPLVEVDMLTASASVSPRPGSAWSPSHLIGHFTGQHWG